VSGRAKVAIAAAVAFLAITAGASIRLIHEAKPGVPIGPYSGALTQLEAREALLGQTSLPTWVFLGIGQVLPPGWDSGRILLVNIHARVGSTHIPWRDITNATTYDAGLIASISSLDLDSTHVYLSVHEEMDGLGDVHGTPEEFRAFYAKISALAAIYAPKAEVGQVLATADRLATWVVRDADFYGFDPHFYGWPTPSFQAQLNNVFARMAEAGVGGRPFIINTGGVENPDDPNAKARWIAAMCARLKSNTEPEFLFATWWDRAGVVNGKAVDERFDSSPQSLAAYRTCYDSV
jgi:hypothetical protein